MFFKLCIVATSSLLLDNGATAVYESGSGTTSVTYRYTVDNTDADSSDLTVASFVHGDALDVDGTIGAGLNLGDNRDIVIGADNFIAKWQTTAPNETITLPLPDNSLVYNFTIDWEMDRVTQLHHITKLKSHIIM